MNKERHELKLGKNTRVNFSDRDERLEIPNLNDIQTSSYEKLVDERLDLLFKNYFPITDEKEELEFRYVKCFFDVPEVWFEDEV